MTLQVVFDAALAALSVPAAMVLRVGTDLSVDQFETLSVAVLSFVVIAVPSFYFAGLYGRVWRYASIRELVAIVYAALLALGIFTIALFFLIRLEAFPRSAVVIQWLILVMALGAVRLGPRLWAEGVFRIRFGQLTHSAIDPAIVVGTGNDADLFIQALRRDPKATCRPVAILDPTGFHVNLSLRDVPVMGTASDLRAAVERLRQRGVSPRFLIIAEPASRLGSSVMQRLISEGESLGLDVRRPPAPTDLRRAQGVELKPIELADLLGRPQAQLNRAAIDRLIEGRRVLVTGAGGTIGSELTRQIAALGPTEIALVESCEYNLYEIDMALKDQFPQIRRVPLLCNIRERDRVMQIFDQFRPELVFHAAALKHVPMVEVNPAEGVHTNVVGTRNIADAAFAYGVRAMVQISTDKAVNPTSVMGATKRLGELYCQALDLKGKDTPEAPRFMTVRFGNVLGSSGSLIPLFERQLKRGGPLTVTHPEIKRFFMTVREAVELVLQASAHGLENREEGLGQIFVLDMGEPVKIIDIARRMIRLAGLQPERDVRIEITGLRPGEKLFEELFDEAEARLPATVSGVMRAKPDAIPLETLREAFSALGDAAFAGNGMAIRQNIQSLIPGYKPWVEGAVEPLPGATVTMGTAPQGRRDRRAQPAPAPAAVPAPRAVGAAE